MTAGGRHDGVQLSAVDPHPGFGKPGTQPRNPVLVGDFGELEFLSDGCQRTPLLAQRPRGGSLAAGKYEDDRAVRLAAPFRHFRLGPVEGREEVHLVEQDVCVERRRPRVQRYRAQNLVEAVSTVVGTGEDGGDDSECVSLILKAEARRALCRGPELSLAAAWRSRRACARRQPGRRPGRLGLLGDLPARAVHADSEPAEVDVDRDRPRLRIGARTALATLLLPILRSPISHCARRSRACSRAGQSRYATDLPALRHHRLVDWEYHGL